MKRLLLIFFLFPMHAFALYSEYGDWSDWVTEKIEETELIYVESETRYKWYKEYREDIGYIQTDDNYLIDKSDYEYTPFTKWDKMQCSGDEKEEKDIYKYRVIKPIRYIKISDVIGSYDCFRITEIVININGKKLIYSLTCTDCITSSLKYLYNNIYNENIFYLVNGGEILVDLKGYYNIWEIDLNIYLYDRGYNEKEFKISFILNEKTYAYKKYNINFRSQYLVANKFGFIIDKNWIYKPEYYDYIETEEEVLDTYYNDIEIYKLYRCRDKLYMHYSINREYLDGCYENMNGYIKDTDDYKIYYRKKERYFTEETEEVIERKEIVKKENVLKIKEEKEVKENNEIKANAVEETTILSIFNFKLYIIILIIILIILFIML